MARGVHGAPDTAIAHHAHAVSTRYSHGRAEARSQRLRPPTLQRGEPMPIVEHDAVMHTDEGVLDWCRQLSRYGFCIVNSVPVESGMVKTVASRIAPTQQHIYGDVFDVKVCSAVCSAHVPRNSRPGCSRNRIPSTSPTVTLDWTRTSIWRTLSHHRACSSSTACSLTTTWSADCRRWWMCSRLLRSV